MIDLYLGLSPILVVALGATLLMLAEAFGSPKSPEGLTAEGKVIDAGAGRSGEIGVGAAVVLFSGAIVSIALWIAGPETLDVSPIEPYLVMDRFSAFISFTICLGAGLAALLAAGYLPEHGLDRAEFFPLLMFSTVGGQVLAASGDMLSLFIGLETLSLGVYCMIGLRRGSPRSAEASMKYFLLGSFAAALMLMGAAALYGATGHTDLAGIGQGVAAIGADPAPLALVIVGLVLMLAGLAFKVSAVPFHMWTPDAYEGAPTPATAFMAVVVKAAAFAVMMRVLIVAFPSFNTSGYGWPAVLAVLAVLTMSIANVIAGRQSSVKRMLAYSSVAHAGYILVGIVAIAETGQVGESSVLFYLLTYAVSTAGAFGALIYAGSRGAESVSYEDLAGLGKRHPPVAFAFSIFLLSLAGFPPLAGFFGKLYIFQAAIDAKLYGLTIIGLINSVVGAYYYLRVMVFMYMREPAPGAPVAVPMRSGLVALALVISALFVFFLGILPSTGIEAAQQAATVAAVR